MKKMTRILSVALIAVMMLSLSAVALADDTTVFIPARLSKLGLPDMPSFITLKTKTESIPTYGNEEDPTDPCPILAVEDADIELFFSEKPDWAGVIWAEGYENLEVDDEGYAVTSMEGHLRQPGTWSASGKCDPITGKPEWHVTGGDYAYMAGKGPVSVQYGRSGKANYVEYTVEEDFFATGMEGASTVIRWEPIRVKSTSTPGKVRYDSYWYVASVTATYPAGNYIVGVKANYRNDTKTALSGYTITYATSETETYAITYAPATATILEDHLTGEFVKIPGNAPSTDLGGGLYLHHYTADEPIYGEYTVNGTTYVSGSGKKLNKWFASGHGKQLKKSGLKGVTSFKSPRRTVK